MKSSILWLIISSMVVFPLVIYLVYRGVIWPNAVFTYQFPFKGLDVSHHQGKIDWRKVGQTAKYSFVYIKATEGHDFFDDDFVYNWNQAKEQGFKVGAYHFFSLRSSGKEQADYFISVVPKIDDSLPPVIDIEVATDRPAGEVRASILEMSEILEKYYKKKPILYVTFDTYHAYVKSFFLDHHIWLRSITHPPLLFDRDWLFWQYNNRGHVEGIEGYVDINVFRADAAQLEQL